MRVRPVVVDNIATPGAPVWRQRIPTPLTPRTVRNELIKQSQQESSPESWLAARMTPLDKLLSDDEAEALELYVDNERLLAGQARIADYAGDRVQSSRSDMAPINEDCLARLARHHGVKMGLDHFDRAILKIFVAQMDQDPDAPCDAVAALQNGLPGRRADVAWQMRLKEIAGRLV